MKETDIGSPIGEFEARRQWFWAVWAVTAAFGTYFCMYGFRKPFTAAGFEGTPLWGVDFKTVVVTTQVLGYMLSKFIGIKVIAEMPPHRRAVGILLIIAVAQTALVLFGLFPRPWNALFLFFNGLSLGMVFGLVLGFLEGRRLTEALAAGLCASFILADGVTKSVGTWLLHAGVTEDWMPSAAGMVFLIPLCIGVAMLTRIPVPDTLDVQARSERLTMDRDQRRALYGRYAVGLSLLVGVYLLTTVVRSVRADFAPELWAGLGETVAAGLFARSELVVALGILVVAGAGIVIRDNRLAFFASLAICCFGFLLIGATLLALRASLVSPFWFMVLIGLGLYLPYVVMHTTVFERLLAMTRERGNLGFLIYVADAIGYLGYVVVMISRNFWPRSDNFLDFFLWVCWVAAVLSLVALLLSWRYFANAAPRTAPFPAVEGAV